jgi:peptidoglycan/LPS O-acetylase OafA/YrhL
MDQFAPGRTLSVDGLRGLASLMVMVSVSDSFSIISLSVAS